MCDITLLNNPLPDRAPLARLLLAHGAGAGMQTEFMSQMAALLSARGIAVTRFEFSYMAQRRIDGKRRPPPRVDLLRENYLAAVRLWRSDHPAATGPMLIGGKSLGGRVATLVAGELHSEAKITGIICLGYPFHPPKMPLSTRTAHLVDLAVPTLVIQGERDPFGTRDEVAGYDLSHAIQIDWAKDGDHDLKPRAGKGTTHRANLVTAADAIAAFAVRLTGHGTRRAGAD